ncbi:autotransporter outer membrane beta-barrel domain-containing protein [Anaerobiospirillum sp. NML120449]|uniref:autotransporter domain-containing protein n=1 Tax=Anaerobiospirillum sp. NML120449 TaxID=2932817 RepID=UPI001FF41822|nr:autotransporter outer membrane beta-barrel domain-containing protein [Anaerobiospirillum sp. NML120449]MCK0526476.1 autotransporter domain-containing protein [Anaerobiospirillum sp. NML120449]
MKLSNNAIKFLMAQYRAIYKNAYFKGIASAVVLTSVMAAGQAQAAALTDLSSATGDITITGASNDSGTDNKWEKITVSGSGSLAAPLYDITITSGSGSKISASGNAATLVSTKALNITGKKATDGISFMSSGDKGIDVSFSAINLEKGAITLNAKDSTAAATLTATTITLGSNAEGVELQDGDATIVIGKSGAVGTIKAGDIASSSTITLNKGGLFKAGTSGSNQVADATISAGSLLILGGKLHSNSDGDSGSTLNVKLVQGEMNGGSIEIDPASKMNITFDATSGITKDEAEAERILNLKSGSLVIKGDTTISGAGTIVIADDVTVTGNTGKEAAFKVSGSGADAAAVVQLSKAALAELAGQTKAETKNTIIKLTDTGEIDVVSLKLSGSSAVGTIKADSGSVISASNILVSDKLKGVSGTLSLEAKSLTLGSKKYSGTESLKFSGAVAEDLTLLSNGAFTLKDKITLTRLNADGKAVDGKITAEDVVVSAADAIKIDGGKYVHENGKITLSSGTMSVTNTGKVDVSSLTLKGQLVLDIAKSGTISANGSNTVLDITGADVNLSGSAAKVIKLAADNGGNILVTGATVEKLQTQAGTGSGAIFDIGATAASTLTIDGDLSLAAANISGAQTKSGIKLTNGVVNVNGGLTLSNAAEINLGANAAGKATLKVQSLDATVTDPASGSTIKSGDYVITGGLKTNSTKGFIVSGSGAVFLGDITADPMPSGSTLQTYTSVGGGTVSAGGDNSLEVSGGSVTVQAGNWNAGGIKLTSGNLVIGQKASNADAAGNVIGAKLKTSSLTIADGQSGASITSAGTLDAAKMSVGAGGKLSVSGQLNLVTEYDGTATTDSLAMYGLKLGDNAVEIKQGGVATLGGTGVLTLLGIKDGAAVTDKNITDAASASGAGEALSTSGSFVDAAGATLKLDLAEGTSFDTKALEALQGRLYGTDKVNGTIDIGAATISDVAPDANNEIKWETLPDAAHNVLPNYKNEALMGAVLVGKDGNTMCGHVGSIKIDTADTSVQASVDNKVSLNKADAYGNLVSNKNGDVLGITAADNTYLELDAAGKVGSVSLGKGATLDVGAQNGAVTVAGVNGKSATLVNGGNIVVTGTANVGKLNSAEGSSLEVTKDLTVNDNTVKTVVNGNVTVGGKALFKGDTTIQGNATVGSFESEQGLTTAAGSNLNVTTGGFNAENAVTAQGNIKVTSGTATFKSDAQLSGADNQFKDAEFSSNVTLAKGVTTATTVTLKSAAAQNLNVNQGGTLDTDVLTATSGSVIKAGTFGNKETKTPGSTGFISVGTLNLEKGELIADPEFGSGPASVIAVKQLGTDVTGFQAGVLNGSAYALQNSIIAFGNDNIAGVQSTFAKYFDANGSLKRDDVGAVAYIAEDIKVSANSKIVVDSAANDATLTRAGYTSDITLGANSVLAVSNKALDRKADGTSAAVTFAGTTATITADKTSKVVIAADGVNALSKIDLFNTTDNNGAAADTGITLSGSDLLVETMNGLFTQTLKQGEIGTEFTMNFNANKANQMFAGVSQPVRDTIITYAYGAHNPAADTANGEDNQMLVGNLHSEFVYDATAGIALKGADGKADANKTADEVNAALVNAGLKDAKTGETFYSYDVNGNVYRTADNKLLSHVLATGNGVDAETAARLADFGGVAQAALRAGNTTSDAIAARMGVGVNGTVTFAANGQGSGMWVTPVYKTADSDSFGADGVDYGTDMNLYGVAVGADVSVMENVSAGVMFNVGSGDADGQGLGSNVKNDFDYYGFGAYMGYTMGAASVVADVSWTTVDNSVEGQTGLGTLAASIDSSALSLGVTGKYAMDFGGVNVTPHAGLRFTRIDQDDYSVGNGTDVFAQYSSNSMNVFSVPVGVTVEKEYTFDAWSVKPAFDLTLTGNFGDDETSGTVDWEGISNLSTDIKSEFVDTFTYSTAIGVAAQTGNFGMGLGVNYTGASNVKEFGVNANVRYVF